MISRTADYFRRFPSRFWVLSLAWFVSAWGFGISIPFISIYFHSTLGLSLSQIGVFFGALAVVRSFFQILGGEVADRVERRSLLIHFQVIRAVAFFLLAAAVYARWGFWAVAACLLVNSIFGALFQPVANAAVSDILPAEQRLEGFAVTRSAVNLGWAAGPALGGFMAAFSYGLLFVISGVITLGSGLVVMLWLHLPKRLLQQESFRLSDLVAIRRDPNLAVHAGLIFFLYLLHSQLIAPFSVYAVDVVKISEGHLGLLYTLNGIMVVTLQIPVTRLLSRFRLTTQMSLGAAVYLVGYSLIGLLDRFALFVPAVVIITAGEMIVSPPALALTSRLAPENRSGRYMGIFGFAVAAGWSFGPLAGGMALDRLSPWAAWLLLASLALVPGLGYSLVFRRRFLHCDGPGVTTCAERKSGQKVDAPAGHLLR